MSLSDIGETGNIDQNQFEQENTVIEGHLRLKTHFVNHFMLERAEKG